MREETLNRPACADRDPELFFPTRAAKSSTRAEREAYRAQVAEAKAVCEGCPVRGRCLETFLFEPEGIFAGTTPHDREIIRWGDGRRGKPGPKVTSNSPKAIQQREWRAKHRLGLATRRPLSQDPRAVRERERRARLKATAA